MYVNGFNNKQGLIISGYQGIGKSFISKLFPEKFIDHESSHFFVNGVRDPNWFVVYVNQAIDLVNKGYTVFISSHWVVRDYLDEIGQEFLVITPSIDIKEDWIERLQLRYNATNSSKDFKSLENAKAMYEESVTELIDNHTCIILDSLKYNLADV